MRELVFVNGKPTVLELTREQMVCSPLQARKAMRETPHSSGYNLLVAVESLIYSLDDEDAIMAWQYATEWQRTNPMIDEIGAALGLTDTDLDVLFTRAMSI